MNDRASHRAAVEAGYADLADYVKKYRDEPERSGMFRDHSCWKCGDGARPCVGGNPRQCEYPHARND